MKKHKVIIVTVLATLVVAGVLLFALEKLRVTNFFSSQPTGLSSDEMQAGLEQKAAVNTPSTDSSKETQNDTQTDSQQPTPEQNKTNPTSSENITLTANKNGSNVVVYTQLKDYSNGTCALTVTNGSKTVTQSAQVMFQPQYSICAGFTVPISSVGSGSWTMTLSVTSDGVTTQKTIQYEVTP